MDERITQALSAGNITQDLRATLTRHLSLNPRFEVDPQVDVLLAVVGEAMARNNQVLMMAVRTLVGSMRTTRAVTTEGEKAVNQAVERAHTFHQPIKLTPPDEYPGDIQS
jgi:hypothetical protein